MFIEKSLIFVVAQFLLVYMTTKIVYMYNVLQTYYKGKPQTTSSPPYKKVHVFFIRSMKIKHYKNNDFTVID